MSEFRRDPLFGTVSILARERAARPHRIRLLDQVASSVGCPLCPGNEAMAPAETARLSEIAEDGQTETGRWMARSFPNRYPALGLEAPPEVTSLENLSERAKKKGSATEELFVSVPGFGVHEVPVEGPNHALPFYMQDPVQSHRFFGFLQTRLKDLYRDRRILYTQVYKNHRGAAGGSIDHPHFQLIGLPFVPEPVSKLLTANHHCRVCELVRAELAIKERRVPNEPSRFLAETSHFVALADYAPAYAYQFSIYPKTHTPGFEEQKLEDLQDLAEICAATLGRFERMLGDLAFNLVLYTQPNPDGFAKPKGLGPWHKTMHWFIRITPRIARHAGFELSTGIPIVQVAPEDAARSFREKGV